MGNNADIPDRLEPAAQPARRRRRLGDLLIALALIAAGAAVLVVLRLTSPRPPDEPQKRSVRLVRVMEARKTAHRCRITAYGTSRASREWTAIAEVRGEAKFVAPRFETGEILPAGTLLVQIDEEEYRLARDRYQAEVAAQKTQLDELKKTKENLEKVLKLQEEQLELSDDDLARLKTLAEKNTVTEADVETAESAQLTRLLTYTQTKNQLALTPILIARTSAARDAAQAQWKLALRDLAHCRITLPFEARCASKSIEQNQYVNVGERLGRFLAMDSAEVVAMVAAGKGAALFPHGVPGHPSVDLRNVNPKGSPLDEALALLDAEVHWGSGKPWRGKVTRLGSSMDPATQCFPVVIQVPNPYSDLVPGVRPPLVPDVFCEVTLWGMTVDDVVVIPRDSLHEMPRGDLDDEVLQTVYVLEGASRQVVDGEVRFRDGRLSMRQVSVLVEEGQRVVIDSGIEDGDLVILGDFYVPHAGWRSRGFSPASEAMPLDGVLVSGTPANDQPAGPDGRDSPASPGVRPVALPSPPAEPAP